MPLTRQIMKGSENKWFNDIVPQEETTLRQSVGYLDRMISGGTQKQYLISNRKGPIKQTRPQKQNDDKRTPRKLKHSKDIIDDAKWIEERRNRFPKVGADKNPSKSQVNESNPQTSQNKNSSSGDTTCRTTKKSDNMSNSSQRKKTLFQKLMDMD